MSLRMLQETRLRTPAEKALFCANILVLSIFAIWAACFVPMNNDEVLPYRILGWMTHPFSHYQFEGDGIFDLTTAFGLRMHRSYGYTGGIVSSFLYSPFYFLFHAAGAQYVYGAIWLVGFAVMSARLMAKPLVCFILITSFFPFAFNFMHDLGPIKLAFLAFPLGAHLYRKAWLAETPLAVFYGLLIAGLLIAGLEDKIFFLVAMPSFFLFCLAFQPGLGQEPFDKKRFILIWGVVACFAAAALCVFLTSTFPDGHSYMAKLMADSRWQQQAASPRAIPHLFSHNDLTGISKWFAFALLWPYYAHRYFDFAPGDENGHLVLSPLCWFAPASGLWLLAVFGSWRAARRGKDNARIFSSRIFSSRGFWLAASSGAMLLSLSLVGAAWGAHHYVFLWLPFVFLLAHLISGLDEKRIFALAGGFLLLNAACLLAATQYPLLQEVSPERQAVLDYFARDDRAEHAVISYLDWGNSLIQELYGPEDQITTSFVRQNAFNNDFPLAQKLGREMYVICRVQFDTRWEKQIHLENRCAGKNLENGLQEIIHAPLAATDMLPGLQSWRVYKIEKAAKP